MDRTLLPSDCAENSSDFRADFKNAVRALCRMHQDLGAALVNLRGTSFLPLASRYRLAVHSTHPDGIYRTEGIRFSAKQLRKALFEYRSIYDRESPTTCLWSVYNPESNQSVFGVGILILAAQATSSDVILTSISADTES